MIRTAHLAGLCLLALGAAVPGTAQALTPPPPACIPADASVTVEALGTVLAGTGPFYLRQCAVNDLAARGAAAVPVVVALLDSSDVTTVHLALDAVAALGPQAQAALPALQGHIVRPRTLAGNDLRIYQAVGALGAAGRPAIALLISKSREPGYRYQSVAALGKLGQYDAQRVVPHLIALLESVPGPRVPIDAPGLLDALRDIGKPARAALPATLASLEQAKAARDSMHGAAAIRALLAIAEPGEILPLLAGLLDHPMLAGDAIDSLSLLGPAAASTVPALIEKLGRSRNEPHMPDRIVRGLAEIAPASPLVQQQLLVEATQYESAHAAYVLAHSKPLPARFAPALTAALASKPGDVFLGMALANARQPE